MFDASHYVPILKGKMGEYAALEHLAPGVRASLTPVIEVPPIAWDYESEQPGKTIDQHLLRLGRKLSKSWPDERPIFLDLMWVEDNESMSDGRHPLSAALADSQDNGVKAIPVTGFRRDPAYQRAVRDAVEQYGLGFSVRLQEPDFDHVNQLEELIAEFILPDVNPEMIDLIIDFAGLQGDRVRPFVIEARAILNDLPNPAAWRTLTLAGSAFPQNLAGLQPGISHIPRLEWHVWREIATGTALPPRIPTFGDYGISHPVIEDVDFRVMRMSAQLRYAAADDWLIVRGRDTRLHGHEQIYDLCRRLVERPEYSGSGFSWGDERIDRYSREEEGPGNAGTWRQIGTSHHLSRVVDQISNLSDS